MKRILGWIVTGLFHAGRAVVCSSFFHLGTLFGPVWPAARGLRVQRRHSEPKAWQSRNCGADVA